MWFGVLISCTDGRRFYNTLQNNASLHISQVHTGNGKTLNLATFFLTKSDRISSETPWLFKFEIWCVSVGINCNFFRYVNQVSHRNNQPFPFFKFLTWYEVWYLSSDIRLPISTNIPLTEKVHLWHMSYTKNDI